MGPRQSCDAKRASRTARDASRHLVALVGLHRRRAVHEYALHAMLVVGSEAPCMTRARVYAALVGRVRVFRPPQRGRRKGTWRARARQDAFFKVPLERDQLTRRVALPPLGRLARGLGQSKIRHSDSRRTRTGTRGTGSGTVRSTDYSTVRGRHTVCKTADRYERAAFDLACWLPLGHAVSRVRRSSVRARHPRAKVPKGNYLNFHNGRESAFGIAHDLRSSSIGSRV